MPCQGTGTRPCHGARSEPAPATARAGGHGATIITAAAMTVSVPGPRPAGPCQTPAIPAPSRTRGPEPPRLRLSSGPARRPGPVSCSGPGLGGCRARPGGTVAVTLQRPAGRRVAAGRLSWHATTPSESESYNMPRPRPAGPLNSRSLIGTQADRAGDFCTHKMTTPTIRSSRLKAELLGAWPC